MEVKSSVNFIGYMHLLCFSMCVYNYKLMYLKISMELVICTVGIAQYGYRALPCRIFISFCIMLQRVHYLFKAISHYC